MKTLEEKAAEVTKRWAELHKPEFVNAKKVSAPTTEPWGPDDSFRFDSLFASFFKDKKNVPVSADPSGSEDIKNLKNPIIWIGKLAVGQDKRFANWWNVVSPTGITISYFGPQARERALEQARAISKYYE